MSSQTVLPQSKLDRQETGFSEAPLSVVTSSSSGSSHRQNSFQFPSFSPIRSRTPPNPSSDLSSRAKFFRSRSKSPVPMAVQTTADRTRSPSSPEPTPYLEYSRRTMSPTPTSPTGPRSPTSPFRPRPEKRNSYSSRKSSGDYRRFSGTVNHYGRHSNDWLFGGFSLRDTVRDGVEKLLNNDDTEG